MNLHELAVSLVEDFDAHKPGSIFENPDLQLSIDDAYHLQFEVASIREARGEQVAGYKIGCISETMQRQLGIEHPVFGHVWDTEIFRSGVRIFSENFDGLAIEGELAVQILDDVPSSAWLRKNPDVVAGHHVVIELHNHVFRGRETIRAAELVANNAIHAGVVLAESDNVRKAFSPHATIRVDRNSQRLGESPATHLQHGAASVVALLAEHLELRGRHLKRGQIVLTGSPLPLWGVAPGDLITVQCDGLAGVECVISKRNQ